MLLFFAISGIWQTLGLHWKANSLTWLSTLHNARGLKDGSDLSSPVFRMVVIAMAVSFVISTLLGVMMALKHGRSRWTTYRCLAFGVLFPLAVIIIFHRSQRTLRRAEVGPAMKLAQAAANGEFDALTQMNALCQATSALPAAASDQGDKLRDFRQAFDYLGSRAGEGNDRAVESLLRALQLDYLQGFAVEGLGKAAGMGNQKALEPLLHPVEAHILPSGAVPALKAAAENGNQKAIEGLAAWAADPAFGYEVVDGLQKPALLAGNVTAIDALGLIAKGHHDSESELARHTLETASSNHIARATEVLHQLTAP